MTVTHIKNVNLATMTGVQNDTLAVETNTELWLQGDKIIGIGPQQDHDFVHTETVDAQGMWCLPGFIDCHTHLVYGGSRAGEFQQRLSGVSYQQISEQGGGIKSTVAATRQLDEQALLDTAIRRTARLTEEGVTTVEIKSGYGLDKDTEKRMLTVAARIPDHLPVNVQRTYLGAHALPEEYKGDSDGYIDYVCDTMMPYIAQHNLATAVDVFCESVGFSLAQTRRVFEAAHRYDLRVKIHAEQLSDSKGARLAAEFGALSVDHIEYLHEEDISAIADAGSVAVLLPGAFYFLKETQLPPIAGLRSHRVPMAIATDMNPGTSPISSILTCANMACIQFGLTIEESLRGITVNAAKALELPLKGQLAVGFDADLCLWNIDSPADLIYEINGFRPAAKWLGGKRVL